MVKKRELTIVCRPQDALRFRGLVKTLTVDTSVKTGLIWLGAKVDHLCQCSLHDAGALPHDLHYFGFFGPTAGDDAYTFACDGKEFRMIYGFTGQVANIRFDRDGNPNGRDLARVYDMVERINTIERWMCQSSLPSLCLNEKHEKSTKST